MARIDKYLHAIRFYKTRSLAAQAVDKGQVQLNQHKVKPAKDVKVGDKLTIKLNQLVWELEVLALSEVRASASIAQTLYLETDASRAARQMVLENKKLYREPAAEVPGRPTKRDRRQLAKWRDAQ